MGLLDLLLVYLRGESSGFLAFLNDLNKIVFNWWSDLTLIYAEALFALAILLTVGVGIFAYQFVKPFLATLAGIFGYFVGVQFYFATKVDFMPWWLCILVGLLFAAAFVWLSYGRASYVWYLLVAVVGYCFVRFYLADNLWAALGGAFIAAMLAIAFFRVIYVAFTGVGCGVLLTSFICAYFPDSAAMAIRSDNVIFWLLCVLFSAAFITAQILLLRRKRKV